MSATEEREIEIVAGTIGGITQKKADTWTVQVTPEGSNYAKNLWTKDADLVVALGAKLGAHGAFVGSLGPEYTVSTPEGEKKVRSWWIDSMSDGTENVPEKPTGSVATPAAAPKDVDWDAKERRDYRSRAWAQTLGAFNHTITVGEEPLAVFKRLHPFQEAVYRDVVRGLYAPDDDDVPFE